MASWKKTPKASTIRSSRPEVFCKQGVLRNFAKFTGKHLCQSLFFNKVALAFSSEFYEISKEECFANHYFNYAPVC